MKKDDRYNLARRNEVARTYNRNQVSANNDYTERTREVLEKLGRLATAVADKLGWDAGLVMQDFIKDLRLINDPSLVRELDASNPIDQMTAQVMEIYTADPEAFNVFRNNAVNQIMHMDEEEAANTLYQMFNRGQITGANYQRIAHNENEMIEDGVKPVEPDKEALEEIEKLFDEYGWDVESKQENFFGGIHYQIVTRTNTFTPDTWEEFVEKNLEFVLDEVIDKEYHCAPTFCANLMKDGTITAGVDIRKFVEKEETPVQDAKADDDAFAEKFGADNLARYKRLSQKLEGNYRDITWVIAHVENSNDLNEMLNVAEFGDYTPIAENDKFIVFDIDSLQMCQKLGKNTTWCITAPTAYNTNARFGARYHFYINKITGQKYCVAMVGGMNEIVDQNDNELARLPEGVPAVGEEEVVSSVVNEDKTSAEALLQTALANINLLPIDTLRVAYDDMFGDELDILEDEEVKEWLLEKLSEVDTETLKTYIEEHIDDFVVVPEENDEDEDYDNEDIEEIELQEDWDDDEEEAPEHSKEEVVDYIVSKIEGNELTEVVGTEEDDDYVIIKLNFTDKAYDLMATGTADNFYRKEMNITVFTEEVNENKNFEVVVNRLGNEEDRIWTARNTRDFTGFDEAIRYFSDEEIKNIIEEQNEVYE